ncbi:MAG: signal peptidase I [Bacteroidia bacterium]|nr:signal peptidase I [Bacteroidia bacterium]
MNKRTLKWIGAFTGAIVAVLLLRGFLWASCLIPSTGMAPTLLQGERLIVNQWSYGLRTPLMKWFGYHRWHEKSITRGEVVLFNNPGNFKEPVIDRRELFISRCAGIPGDTLLVDSTFLLITQPPGKKGLLKSLYSYPDTLEMRLVSILTRLGLEADAPLDTTSQTHIRAFDVYQYNRLKASMKGPVWLRPMNEPGQRQVYPIVVPGKGRAVRVYPWNILLLRNTLVLHEGKKASIQNETLYVDGRPTQHCIFTKDYYWMCANQTRIPSDSRLFGLVPKDHIIGRAGFIWFSKEPYSGPLKGYRWDRLFHSIN